MLDTRPSPIQAIELRDVERQGKAAMSALRKEKLAVIFRDLFSRDDAKALVGHVYALAEAGAALPGAGKGDRTIGRVWYASKAHDQEDAYFEEASQSRSFIRANFPGLEDRLLEFCSILVGQKVECRDGWAGPGFVIFAANSECGRVGGSLHIDAEGIPPEYLDNPDTEAYSFIAPLQTPESGGDLRVWPDYYTPAEKTRFLEEITDPRGEVAVVEYRVGDLVAIDSFRVHQIEPFQGKIDRVCLTFHMAKLDGKWQVWF